jgi:hypothetical protein
MTVSFQMFHDAIQANPSSSNIYVCQTSMSCKVNTCHALLNIQSSIYRRYNINLFYEKLNKYNSSETQLSNKHHNLRLMFYREAELNFCILYYSDPLAS